MVTRATLLGNAKERFGDPNNQVYSDTYWNNRLQEAYRRVQGSNPFWPWLENSAGTLTVTGGTNSVALAAGTRRLIAVYNATDTIPMVEITGAREFRRLYPAGLVTEGLPIHYRLSSGTMFVYPTPTADTEIDVDFSVMPGTFGTGTDEPEWPTEWHDMLTEYALAHGYLDDGNLDQYQAHMAVFTAQLGELTRSVMEARGDGYAQIDDNWYQ